MGGGAIEADEYSVGCGCPCWTSVGAIETDCVGGKVFEFAELGIFGGGGDADLAAAGGCDGSVGLDVARHDG